MLCQQLGLYMGHVNIYNFLLICRDNKKRRCGMIANETTLHKKPNNTETNNYRLLYSLQQ